MPAAVIGTFLRAARSVFVTGGCFLLQRQWPSDRSIEDGPQRTIHIRQDWRTLPATPCVRTRLLHTRGRSAYGPREKTFRAHAAGNCNYFKYGEANYK